MGAMRLHLRLCAAVLLTCMSLVPVADAICDATCSCANLQFGVCLDQGVCGNKPCQGPTPNAECPQDPPASLMAAVIGDGQLAIYWEDPLNIDLVDEFNVWYSTLEGATACSGLASGTMCAFTLPGEETPRSGTCGRYAGGTMYCWLDLFPKLLAVLPCVKTLGPDDPSCNYQTLTSGVEIGRHFWFRVNAGRCCWSSVLDTPGCSACTDPLQNLYCPQSPTYAYADVVALGLPTAVRNLAATILGDRSIRITWSLPADTGSRTSSATDLTLVRVTVSTVADFSTTVSVTDLANTALQRDESALTPGVLYYLKVEVGNSACGAPNTVCGGVNTTNIVAVGIASVPASLGAALVAGVPGAFDLTWAAPVDTGQGNGAASTVEPVIRYDVLVNGAVRTSQTGLTYRVTSLTIGTTYTLAVRAVNRAGDGNQVSTSKVGTGYPSAPTSFAASVNAVDGPLKIRLTWSTPTNTGRGSGNQVEELTGYRVLLASCCEVVGGTGYTSNFSTYTTPLDAVCTSTATCTTTLVLTFGAKRALPYVMRVFASNPVGFSTYAETYEQAVDIPLAAQSLTATVNSPNVIVLGWSLPTDTGVGDQSRPLTQLQVKRSYGTADLSCTLNCSSCSGTCYYSQIGACCSLTVSTTATSTTVSGLPQSETRFYFGVVVGNVVGLGPISNIAGEQGVTVPTAPTALAATYPAALAISLSWAAPTDTGVGAACTTACRPLLLYYISVTGSDSSVVLSQSLATTVTSMALTSLSRSLTYSVQVKVSNIAGNSTVAQLAGLFARGVPAAPHSFSASVGATPYRINLFWASPLDTGAGGTTEPITKYVMEMDNTTSTFLVNNTQTICDNGTVCSGGVACTCSALSATVTLTARRLTAYYFRIKALNQYGASPYATTYALSVGIPSAPQNVSANVTGTRTITVTWSLPTDTGVTGTSYALTYNILQRSYNDAAFTGCALGTSASDACASTATSACCTYSSLGASATTRVVTLPSAGIPLFYFRVFSSNNVGIGTPSASASEQGVDPPSAPLSLAVTTIGPAMFTVDWLAPTNTGVGDTSRPLKSYILEVCRAPDYVFSSIYFSVTLGPTVLTYTKTDFIGGTNYTFRVKATNEVGSGAPSNTVTVPAVSLPYAPRSFTAVVTTPLQIALSWIVPSDTGFGDSTTAPIREYILNVSTNNFTTVATKLFSGTAANFSFTHTGLTKGLTYYYRIYTRTDAGIGPYASAFEQAITAPSAPTNLTLSVSYPLQILVSWSLPTDTGLGNSARSLTQVRLEVVASSTALASPSFAAPNTTLIVSGVLSKNLTGLTQGYYYYVQVVASNSAGDSPASTVQFERGVSLPTVPVSVGASVMNPSEIVVTWTAPSNTGYGIGVSPTRLLAAGGYQLYQSPNSSFASQTVVPLANTALSYTATGLIKGITYYFKIYAVNDAGTSPTSNVASALAIIKPTAPLNPAVAVSTVSQRQLILTWESPADTGAGGTSLALNQYRVQESQDNSTFAAPTNITLSGTTLTLTRSSLNKGSIYYYRVHASNTAGESVASAVVSDMALDRPSVPLNPVLVVSGDMKLTLTWTSPTDTGNGANVLPRLPLLRYTIQVDTISSAMTFPIAPIPVIPDLTTTYIRAGSNLTQGTLYYMTVTAYNRAGASPQSAIVNATAIAVPTQPQSPSATVTNPLEISLAWSIPANTGGIGTSWPLLYYRLTVASNAAFTDEAVVIQSLVLSRVETNLTKALRYYYRVYAVNIAGVSPPSSAVTEEGVDVPTAPINFVIAHTSVELQLRITWDMPTDTGTGGHSRPLLRYMLEHENMIGGSNASFAGSSYPSTGPCFRAQTPSCDPSINSPRTMYSGLSETFTDSSLRKGNTYFYRVVAVNSAGASPFSVIIFEQALVKPSAPINPDVTLTQVLGQPAYLLTWSIPEETGAGTTPMRGTVDLTGAPGTARGGTIYRAQASIGDSFDTLTPSANDFSTATDLFAYRTNLQFGVIYWFRVAAINEVGQGPWAAGATSGPQVTAVSPTEGPALGQIWLTVVGKRFGVSPANIAATIGQTACDPVQMLIGDTTFQCLLAPGTGGIKGLKLSVVGLMTELNPAFAYQGPMVTGLAPTVADADGGDAVTVVGYNFGSVYTSVDAWTQSQGLNACDRTLWISDSSIVCWVGPATMTTSLRSYVGVRVDGQIAPINFKVELLRTNLQEFLLKCPSAQNQKCFDCALQTCYAQKEKEWQPQGERGGDAVEECELLASRHCMLDQDVHVAESSREAEL